MKKLLTVAIVVALTGAFANPGQDSDARSDKTSLIMGLALKGVEKVGINLMFYNYADFSFKEAEVRDRVHLAFMRGGVAFYEVSDSEYINLSADDSNIIMVLSVEIQEVFNTSIYDVEVTATVNEWVFPARDTSIQHICDTYYDRKRGWARNNSVESAIYEYSSEVAEEFVRSYKLNNPAD